jgi:hypothetical protein
MGLPRLERKNRRSGCSKRPHSTPYSDHHIGDGRRILAAACKTKAEGTVSERIYGKRPA